MSQRRTAARQRPHVRLCGGLGGISAAVRANLDTGNTVIILANRSMPIADDLADVVVSRIYGR